LISSIASFSASTTDRGLQQVATGQGVHGSVPVDVLNRNAPARKVKETCEKKRLTEPRVTSGVDAGPRIDAIGDRSKSVERKLI
jgi:hypothetical protein